MKQDILCLMMAYPGFVENVEKKDNGYVYIVMKSGKRIIYDDKKIKNFAEKLANPDLQDMLEQIYPLGKAVRLSEINYDPGRSRVYSLLEDVYGKSKGEIEKKLINVNIGWGSCQFNKNNMASKALNTSMKELKSLAASNYHIASFIYPVSGTYNYRVISGTNRLSPHSFGIAIDLARDKRDYWQWASRQDGGKRLASYPSDIVDIFENNNFIWGGKWGHFDILHFEYRPEIVLKSRYFGKRMDTNKPWYYGTPENEIYVNEYIGKIDKVL